MTATGPYPRATAAYGGEDDETMTNTDRLAEIAAAAREYRAAALRLCEANEWDGATVERAGERWEP